MLIIFTTNCIFLFHNLFKPKKLIANTFWHSFGRFSVLMWIFVLLIEKLHYMEAQPIHIKMDVPFFKVRSMCFPYFRFRMQLLNGRPNPLTCSFALAGRLYIQQIKMISSGFTVNYYYRTTHNLSINYGEICF